MHPPDTLFTHTHAHRHPQAVLPEAVVESRVDVWKLLTPDAPAWRTDAQLALIALLRHAWRSAPLPPTRVFATTAAANQAGGSVGAASWAIAVDLLAVDAAS